MNSGAENPNCGIGGVPFIKSTAAIGVCEHGRQKRLRRLDHMGKSNRPFGSLNRVELSGDRFARCDALQKFRGFFHRKLYAKSARFVAASAFLRLWRFISHRLRRSLSPRWNALATKRAKRKLYSSRPIAAA